MPVAIVKYSYKVNDRSDVIGGICGTAFFTSDRMALSAHHVFAGIFTPHPGYDTATVRMVAPSGKIVTISRQDVTLVPNCELAMIKMTQRLKGANAYTLAHNVPAIGDTCASIGYASGPLSVGGAKWNDNGTLHLSDVTLPILERRSGMVERVQAIDINANDVKVKGLTFVCPNYGGVVGMSGGPCINSKGEVIGFNSFGIPADATIKDRIFVVSVGELSKALA